MNILAASSRQLSPLEELTLDGIKNLIDLAFGPGNQWLIYDKSLASVNASLRKQRQLRNHFRHETLQPFDAVVIAGTNNWHGAIFEGLFKILAKAEVPLWACGLDMPAQLSPFSAAELACFSRATTMISVTSEGAREWLRRFDLESALVASPLLFCYQSAPHARQLVRGPRPKITWVLQDRRSLETISESTIRQTVKTLQKLDADYQIQKVALTVDDFMRFSTMFPQTVRYSYESKNYIPYLTASDVIITSNPQVALLANACEKPAILVSAEAATTPAATPFIFPSTFGQLATQIPEVLAVTNVNYNIEIWKTKLREDWLTFLRAHVNERSQAA